MRKGLVIIWVVAALAVVLRLALPYLLKYYVNRTLGRLEGYTGEVDDIDVNLWRGAYEIENLRLLKTGGDIPVPFFSSREADLSVEWRALWDGALVGELNLERPQLNFVKGPTEAQSQTGIGQTWQEVVQDLFPLKFNSVTVRDGEIHYRDFHSKPPVNVYLDGVYIRATNLTNSKRVAESLVAEIQGSARAASQADVVLDLRLDPFAEQATFDLGLRVEQLDLQRLNDFLQAYVKVDVEAGTISVYTELVAQEGQVNGYVKPLIHDLEVVDLESDDQNPFRLLWEGVVGLASELFENQPAEQLGSRIPIRGRIGDPKVGVLASIWSTVSNAFIEALRPKLDESVDREGENDGS